MACFVQRQRDECRLERRAFLCLQPNPFVNEVRVEAMAEGNAGNRSAGLDTPLNDLGLEGFGIRTACRLHEIPA